ncbi:unnamed protein product, partial [Mesorhabditis belari]|uniref:Uncharacterized protein n=1 Tax=Mesorhabditis belari TaxID=2138241 RepID=A0AAF3J3S9_9BILA
MIDEGTHPELIEQFELFEKRRKRQVELEDIEDEFEEAEIKRISSEMQKKEKEASAEAEERVAGIVQQLLNELDREMKKVDSYISGLDIARPYNEMPCDSSKKILRAPISYLPIKKPTDTGKTIQPPIPLSSKINTFLLKDAEIADDLKSIGTDGKSSPMKGSSHIDVTLSKLKFSYGGRWYKPSEEVLVENREYGKIPAKIDTINDEVVIFKSCFSWDVRQICASSADFAEGRVIIHNKKRNA